MGKVIVLTVALALVGCQSWHGDATVTLKSGEKMRCAKGVRFADAGVYCYGDGTRAVIHWSAVAGYEAR